MKGLFSIIGAVIAYASIGTVLAASLGAGYVWSQGIVDRDKAFKVLAILHDIPLPPDEEFLAAEKKKTDEERLRELSYEEIEQIRNLKSLHIELKQKALEAGLQEVRRQRDALTEGKGRFDDQKSGYTEWLKKIKDETIGKGYEDIRNIWGGMKPKQVKEQIMKMIASEELDEVVAVLSDMETKQQVKIYTEFKSPEELAALDEILRLIRRGLPESQVLDEAIKSTTDPTQTTQNQNQNKKSAGEPTK